MKKSPKITLIVLGILIVTIVLNTLQAKIFDNSPLLKIRYNLGKESSYYIDKGLFVNYYHCNNNEKVTTWKKTKFACSIKKNTSNKEIEWKILTNLDKITEVTDITSSNPFDYTNNDYYKNIVNLGKSAVPILENMYKNDKLTGVNAYLSALVIQDITSCNLLEQYNFDWATAEEFYTYWENNNCSYK